MEKRFLITMLLIAAIFIGWKTFLAPTPPPAVTEQEKAKNKEATPQKTQAPISQALASPQSLRAETILESRGNYKLSLNREGLVIGDQILKEKFASKDAHILTSDGTNVVKKELTGYQPTEMIPTPRPSLRFSFPSSSFVIPPDVSFQLDRSDAATTCPLQGIQNNTLQQGLIPERGCSLVYKLEVPSVVRIRKLLHFVSQSPQIHIDFEVTNLGTALLKHNLQVTLEGYQDPEQKSGLFSKRVPQNEVLWENDEKLKKAPLGDLLDKKDLSKREGKIPWFGIGQQYFIQALGMPSIAKAGTRSLQATAESNGMISASVTFEEKETRPQETSKYQFVLYAGPKVPEQLQDVKVGDEKINLDNSIDYSLAFLARPLLFVLRHIYDLVHNWALAIVLLTLGVKLLTIYPAYLGQRSMKKMSDLKPQMDALREKYGNDKQKLNQETMNLYRKHGINPVGGCLPMLLQMPIYIALYSMLGNAVELYHSPLITERWIQDLTASDPYFILPLLTGGVMFLQTRLTPASPDPQQKMMALMMPVMFTAFSIFLPAGLTLYILTNTILGMIQQFVTNRLHKPPKAHSPKK